MADDEVLVTRDGPVFTLTFNRPQARNAMTWTMYERLDRACDEVDADDEIRVFVLRGAGGKAFVAGTDISQFKVFETAEAGIEYERDGDRRIERLERVKKPVIAQIQGYAVGGDAGQLGSRERAPIHQRREDRRARAVADQGRDRGEVGRVLHGSTVMEPFRGRKPVCSSAFTRTHAVRPAITFRSQPP